MTQRRKWTAIPGLMVLAAGAVMLSAYSGASSSQNRSPIQPINFPHMRHVNAGVTCQTCHGQIQNMDRVYQFASLNMGWCVSCHVNGYSPKEGLEAAGYSAQQQGTPAAAAIVAPADAQSGERKKARYDCANCHY